MITTKYIIRCISKVPYNYISAKQTARGYEVIYGSGPDHHNYFTFIDINDAHSEANSKGRCFPSISYIVEEDIE